MEPEPAKPYRPSAAFVGCLGAIVFFLIFISSPFFFTHMDKDKAKAQSCVSNMKQIGLGVLQYAQDYDEVLPPRQSQGPNGQTVTWRIAVYPYIKNLQIFRCPSNPAVNTSTSYQQGDGLKDSDFPRSYAVNSTSDDLKCFGPFSGKYPNGFSQADALFPSSLALVVESTAGYNDFNVLFSDGHVKPVKPSALLETQTLGANPWTPDGAAFSPVNQTKAASVVEYGAKQSQ